MSDNNIEAATGGRIGYFLLVGGDKSTQQRDITSALVMARELKESDHGH